MDRAFLLRDALNAGTTVPDDAGGIIIRAG
jgi:hypothetical protein